jgi:3-hydroxyacyl-CoA dehydrogenase
MGYGSAALFTQAVPRVTLLARTKAKAEEGLGAAIRQVRSPTVASRARVGDYEHDLEGAVGEADLVFEALTEDFEVKKRIFDRVEKLRRDDAIVATVTSGLSIDALARGRADSFRRHFLGLHFFNPPNVIVGTELVAGRDSDPALVDFVEAFARARLGREIVRTADTPAFAGNRIGFKVLNEAAQLAEELGPVLVDRILGPYTGRALPPLATIDLVGWDIHRAIVDNVYENTDDEAHETLRLPRYMDKLMERGVLGNKTGRGFFWKDEDGKRHALDPVSGDYRPLAEFPLPDLGYIRSVAALHAEGRYREALERFAASPGREAEVARRLVAGYLSYAFHRVGEVASLDGIDRILGTGFNWAPPGALADVLGAGTAVALIEKAGLPVPEALARAARSGEPRRFFAHPHINVGRFFVAG